MSFLWGDKKQEKTKLNFTAKNRRRDLVSKKLRVHLELDMEYPSSVDIMQALRETKLNFDLPPGIELKDAHFAHLELLGDLQTEDE